MNNNLKKLEYDKILEKIAHFCKTYLGKKYAFNLRPSQDVQEVQKSLKETSQGVVLIQRNSTPPIGEIADITIYLKTLDGCGSLSIKALIELQNILQMAEDLKEYFSKDFLSTSDFSALEPYFNDLYVNQSIVSTFARSIIDEDNIADTASAKLQDIRRKERRIEQDIRAKLNVILHSSTYSKYMRENLVTIRSGRYVIPVKEEYRSSIKGFVHDVSSSGSTVFIEPLVVFDLNNELSNLHIEEEQEIERILQNLSGLLFPYTKELQNNAELIGKLDFIFGKARYSIDLNCSTPEINKQKQINLINARHPLIDQEKVVPSSIELGKDFNVLIITGPNTGGKTVTLKTIGLLSAMACSGLNIPADEHSSIYVFDQIFADIGDEQSIEQSLSTFSSHMTNTVSILNEVTSDSLVIFDELGAGTDPVEGAALAIAILEDVNMAGAKCIATTHYSELKNYALTKNGVENAAVEFDVDTLSPTYRLLIGVPGKSNAFEISKKLGLSEYVINRAKEFINTDNIELEDVLQNVEKNRLKAEEDRLEAEKLKKEIEDIKAEYEGRLERVMAQREKIISKAKSEAFSITRQAKEQSENILKELRKLETEMASKQKQQKIEALRKELSDSMGNLQPSVKSMIVPKVSSKEIKDLKPGDDVKVVTLNQDGTVVSVDKKKKEALVQIGIMKMTLPFKSLQQIQKDKKSTVTKTTRKIISEKSGKVKGEVDLRGMNLEEAIMEVEKYLDDACVAGLETVTIIHGIGTGVLKKGLQDILKRNKHVKSKRPGEYGEGGAGVTIVTLR